MRAALFLTVLSAGALAAGAASAQQAPAGTSGLRYLSWPGKVETSVRASATPLRPALAERAAPVQAQATARSTATAFAAQSPVTTPRQGLTPASAWMSPRSQPTPQPASSPTPYVAAPEPVRMAMVDAPIPAPAVLPPAAPARREQPRAEPSASVSPQAPLGAPAPAQGRLVAPSPLAAAATGPTAQPSAPAAVDPMAPRRDAPIFRMQQNQAAANAPSALQPQAQEQMPTQAQAQPQPEPVRTYAATPPSQGARYYSVHRQAGHTPDATPLPQPVYLDGLPVELIQPIQSSDLAEPQAGPTLIRSADGRVRAVPAAGEGDFQ